MWKQNVSAQKFANHGFTSVSDQLLIEVQISVSVNGECIFREYCTPSHQKELVKGILIEKFGIQDENTYEIEKPSPFEYQITFKGESKIRSSWQAPESAPLTPSEIMPLMAQFQDKAALYKDTGTAESAALSAPNHISQFADDIYLKNTLYKLLGLQDKTATTLICSSKVTGTHIPVIMSLKPHMIISRSGFTDKSLEAFQNAKIQCVGFCRGKHLTQYKTN
ncbi:MAG: formate dehydrogenase accessory sulfurtransferase FdhD [bacterium]|nr:formate dehydrogenase accessory sulfurtransferase FdhD [bacterium]